MLSVNKVSLQYMLTLPLLHECLVNGSLACFEMMASAFFFFEGGHGYREEVVLLFYPLTV